MTEIYRNQWMISAGKLFRRQTQPNRELLLERNAKLRREGGLADLTFAGLELRIPEIDYYQLRKKYPDLNAPDGEIRTKAWRRFAASSEADPYRIRDRKGQRAHAPVSLRATTADRSRTE